MKKLTYLLILILLFYAGKAGAQCTISLTSATGTDAQTVCINIPITDITYTTTLANDATVTGLPAGVTGSWTANVVTITGTPTKSGLFNYTVQLKGGCGSVIATGTITVTTNNSITLTSGDGTTSQTVCINSPITNITYSTPEATGANFSGLPAGVNGSWAANVVTISGSPSTSVGSPFNYTVSLTGGCGTATASGTITVNANLPVSVSIAASPSGAVCAGTSVTFIATPTHGGTPSYQWKVNGSDVGSNSPSFTSTTLANNDAVLVVMTSSLLCVTGNPSTSNTITMIVTPPPSASISYTGSPWCPSEGVQNVTLIGTSGGTFSAQAGLTIDASTGTITPGTSSAGTYTVTYRIAASGGCGPSTNTTSVTISPTPTAPAVGTITQPTCSVATGSVPLSGLPSSGWTLTRNPGNVTTAGTGTSTTISNLASGTYTFTVTNSAGCVSPSSLDVVVNAPPPSPATPDQTVDCTAGFGHAKVTVISPTGSGLQYNLDGGPYQSNDTFNSVDNGSHYISVRNASGCTTTGPLFQVNCGCTNPPTVTLSSSAGNTCGTTAVTVTGNSFDGSSTSVTITSNGNGVLNPGSSAVSPFSFTYTPVAADGGKNVIITVTTNNPLGAPCMAGVGTYTLTVNATPTAPAVGTITNLTCSIATGSVVLNGLPPTGTWTLTRSPDAVTTSGTGTSTTVSGLVAGTYTFTVTSAQGCISASSADVVISPQPSSPTPPVVGAITQPTCDLSTGSVVLSGLPSPGNWTLTRSPGGVTVSGSGATTTVSTIPSGTYTFSVTNATGCISSPSGNVLINPQPGIPPAPTVGTITPPGCTLVTGSVILSGLPATGTWTLIRYPGTISTTGTGTSTTLSGLASGTYNFTVSTADGCLSGASANVVMPAQPPTAAAPEIGTITQPTLAVPSGSVVLNGLPSPGAWVITLFPDSLTTPGSGTTATITNLAGGVFTFTVTNSSGCTSAESSQVVISTPGVPVLVITDPLPVCSPATVDITGPSITEGSTPGLTLTFWTDLQATIQYNTPATATAGTYYIKGTTVSGFFNIKPVVVTIDTLPVPNGGPDQTLNYQFSTTLDATLSPNETGIWSVGSGSGTFSDNTDPRSSISDLSLGENILLWSIKTAVCPEVSDTVKILVDNILIPTLITPNMDGRNDYFVVRGLTSLGKTELYIFDRRGVQVYKNLDYDNSWDGIDYNKNPLPDDTYFYVVKPENGKPLSGYIVIRR